MFNFPAIKGMLVTQAQGLAMVPMQPIEAGFMPGSIATLLQLVFE